MRSARIILATAAASAVIAITAPGVYAADGDWEKGDSSYSKTDESTKEDSGYSKDDSSKEDSSKEDSSKEDWSKEDSGKEHSGKDHDKDYDKPHGGMHTGGGALTLVTDGHEKGGKEWSKEDGSKEDSWSKEDGSKEDSWSKEDSGYGKDDSSWSKEDSEDSWSGKDKPHGGVHTGGGALAAPAVTAGGLAVLAVAGAGLYGVRRKKSAHGLA
ncbi:hypothetical protein ABZ464_05140 [Streptomyces sp. NPDC005820]|uniref:hypothetical protein n=1 Tax=Streptomyces sp. NPDC005820 TaxID=3157069 RepID=UPI0033F7A7E8